MNYETIKVKAQLKELKNFTQYLNNNVKEHSNLKGKSYDEMQNSIAFMQDYAKVLDEMQKVIRAYAKTNAGDEYWFAPDKF